MLLVYQSEFARSGIEEEKNCRKNQKKANIERIMLDGELGMKPLCLQKSQALPSINQTLLLLSDKIRYLTTINGLAYMLIHSNKSMDLS